MSRLQQRAIAFSVMGLFAFFVLDMKGGGAFALVVAIAAFFADDVVKDLKAGR